MWTAKKPGVTGHTLRKVLYISTDKLYCSIVKNV